MSRYKNLFFDLDDTLWAFSENARDTFALMYDRYDYNRYFRDFAHFYALYEERNRRLWEEYGRGEVTKEELNYLRFRHPLWQVGVPEAEAERLADAFQRDFFEEIPLRKKVMPHAHEVLASLKEHYRLYILSNGFRELQCHKMHSAGLDRYFRKVVLSDDLGVLKPRPEIFHFALSATQSQLEESLMIGDSWENDVTGAHGVGMHQVFYDVQGRDSLPFRPTFHIHDLKDLRLFL